MPQGKLFIRTNGTKTAVGGQNTTGLTNRTVNNNTYTGWADAYLRYGLSLEDGALAALMAPAPNKKPANVTPRSGHGTAYDGSTIGYKAERNISLDVHITATNKSDYIEKYALFCSEVLDCGYIQLRTSEQPNVIYHLLYDACQQFSHFLSGMAKFTLSLTEPHPDIRYDK